MFHQTMFSFRDFTYNNQVTYLSDRSCYFVFYRQFLRYHCRALQQHHDLKWNIKQTFTVFACVIHSNRPLRKPELFLSGFKRLGL